MWLACSRNKKKDTNGCLFLFITPYCFATHIALPSGHRNNVTLKRQAAFAIPSLRSLRIPPPPPLGNNTNSEKRFVLFFLPSITSASSLNENKRSKFCRFVAAIVAQISQKSMQKIYFCRRSVAFARHCLSRHLLKNQISLNTEAEKKFLRGFFFWVNYTFKCNTLRTKKRSSYESVV